MVSKMFPVSLEKREVDSLTFSNVFLENVERLVPSSNPYDSNLPMKTFLHGTSYFKLQQTGRLTTRGDIMRQDDLIMYFERLRKEGRGERRKTGKQRRKQPKKQGILPISEQKDSKLLEDYVTASSMDPDLYRATIQGDILEFIKAVELGPENRHAGVPAASCVQVTPQKNTVLHLATIFGHDEIVKLICKDLPFLVMETNCRGDTALHIAARAGNSLLVNLLINSTEGVLGVKNETGNTALHEALQHHHEEVAWNIINKDRNMSCSVNKEGKSLLYLAAEAGYANLVRLIMENPAGNYSIEGKHENAEAVKAAILGKSIDVLKIMWERDQSSFNLRCEEGRNPLHHAASIGFVEGINYLLDKHCIAAYQGDKNGLSPIHIAAIKGHFHIIKEMLQHCPDLMELLTQKGQNILHVAAKSGRAEAVSFMLKKMPELEKLINEKDEDGNTPLHLATICKHPKVVRALTSDKRVNLKVENNRRLTALDIADEYMETMASFRKRLTWMALRVAGAPRSPWPKALESKEQNFTQGEPPKLEIHKEKVNIILLVATLVATVTYAAGFTIPGGYNNSGPDQGMATMLPNVKFHAFLICDTIAMYSSIIVAVTLIWAQLGDINSVLVSLKFALPVLGLALAMMSMAFMAGVCIVVSKLSWLADIVMLMSLIFLAILLTLLIPLFPLPSSSSLIVRHLSYYPFHLMIIAIGSCMDTDVEE